MKDLNFLVVRDVKLPTSGSLRYFYHQLDGLANAEQTPVIVLRIAQKPSAYDLVVLQRGDLEALISVSLPEPDSQLEAQHDSHLAE